MKKAYHLQQLQITLVVVKLQDLNLMTTPEFHYLIMVVVVIIQLLDI
jgi:hypothetical protein